MMSGGSFSKNRWAFVACQAFKAMTSQNTLRLASPEGIEPALYLLMTHQLTSHQEAGGIIIIEIDNGSDVLSPQSSRSSMPLLTALTPEWRPQRPPHPWYCAKGSLAH